MLAPTLVLIGALAEHTRPAAYGAAYAIYNLAYTGGLAVAPLLAGSTASALGVSRTTVVAGALAAVVAVVMFTRRQRVSGEPAAEAPRVEA